MSLFPFYMQPTYALTPYEVVYYTRPVRYVRRVQHPLAEPFADALGQLARFSHPEDDDEFLADTPFGKRRASRAAGAPRADGETPEAPEAPRAPQSYSYSISSSTVYGRDGEMRTTVRKTYTDGEGTKRFEERSLRDADERILKESAVQGFGDEEAKVTYEGADGAEAFAAAWAPKTALEPAAEDGAAQEAVAPSEDVSKEAVEPSA